MHGALKIMFAITFYFTIGHGWKQWGDGINKHKYQKEDDLIIVGIQWEFIEIYLKDRIF